MIDSDYRSDRREYTAGELHRADLSSNPMVLFGRWLEAAKAASIEDATAMTVATADANGVPGARTILLKHFDENGLCWYTDKRSPQGSDLSVNPQAELLFFWRQFSRQVRLSGPVEIVTEADSNAYFSERPLGSQFSASASEQSSVIADRATLESRVNQLTEELAGESPPRPKEWGGYRLIPERIEFWQGRVSRLHDRFRYQLIDGDWQIDRLAP